jgi:sodium/bile acid cotransporter 7
MRTFLGKHWFLIVLTLGLAAALAQPAAVGWVTRHWEPNVVVALSLFLIALTMPSGALVAEIRQPFAALWAVVISYGLIPLSAAGLGMLATEDVRIGLILVASVPCTFSSAVLWTRLARGNEATALLTVMGTTLTSWFLTTAWLYWLNGAEVELDVGDMIFKLVTTLIVPVIAGQGLRLWPACARLADRHRLTLGVVSQLLVLAIVLKAGAIVGDKLHAHSAADDAAVFLWSIVLAVVLHLFALSSGMLSGRWLGFERGRQIAIAFAASQKTLPVSLMLYEQYKERFPFAVMPVLFYHVGQLLLDTLIARQLSKSAPGDGEPVL